MHIRYKYSPWQNRNSSINWTMKKGNRIDWGDEFVCVLGHACPTNLGTYLVNICRYVPRTVWKIVLLQHVVISHACTMFILWRCQQTCCQLSYLTSNSMPKMCWVMVKWKGFQLSRMNSMKIVTSYLTKKIGWR